MEALHAANAVVSGTIYSHMKLNRDQQEIRLLKLLPGGDSDALECNLFTADLSIPPRYQALSYTWGDASEREVIQLNHHDFSVTKNLNTALRRLRFTGKCRILWVDALCINLCEDSERNHQVGLMRDIYKSCKEVLIWLGEPQVPKWNDGIHTLTDVKVTRPMSWTMDDQDFVILEDYWQDFSGNAESRGLATLADLDYNFHLFCVVRLLSSNRHCTEIPSFTSFQDLHYPSPFEQYQDLVSASLEAFTDMPWWSRLWVRVQ